MKPSPSKSVRRRRKKKPPRNWRALLLRVASLGLTAVALAALMEPPRNAASGAA